MGTDIATIGEFGLIKRLTEDIKLVNPSTLKGVGDDTAVLSYPADKQILVTTDMLMEGVHFDLVYTPFKHLGYKSAMVNFSDVYAMNGYPKQITVSIAISKRFNIEHLEDFYEGIKLACEQHGVDIIGGDTTTSLTGFAISITCIGEADSKHVVYRSGAKETDLICVTGNLGAAYMGLQLLEREKLVFGKSKKDDIQPDFSGKEYILERQLKPEARKDIIDELAKQGIIPTAMMDISDGLSSELLHIADQSKVGCRIYEENIPIDYQTAIMAEEFGLSPMTAALNGGEDYELLFTVPLTDHEKITQIPGVKLIGHVTKQELGVALITKDGKEIELQAQGWNPLSTK
ncbi:thiamine-phosphate kinase [Bacteroides propionicifaciens]|uniref:thiamine-phosphate kinase n=1 Tax=Bacteroides propionicifaciens TaxID=392838 RepID=UPI0003717591|nr:thiamine-phosphate kinase [Bacteroides propionicifaciens]